MRGIGSLGNYSALASHCDASDAVDSSSTDTVHHHPTLSQSVQAFQPLTDKTGKRRGEDRGDGG